MDKMKVLIIGGTGVMGQFFAVLLREEYEVLLSSRDDEKGREVAQKLNVEYTPDRMKEVGQADIVLLSTPINDTPKLIKELVPIMRKGSLLMDLDSVKTNVEKAFLDTQSEDVDYISIHPMFCPPTETKGQNIIFIPIKVDQVNWINEVKNLLESFEFNVHESTVEKHDEIMSIIQVLIHLSFIGVSSTIKEMNYDSRELRPYMGKFHKVIFDFIPRVTTQSSEMYALIQLNNPNSKRVCEILSKKINKLKQLVDSGDSTNLIKELQDLQNIYPDKDKSISRSNKLIDLYKEEK